MLSKLTIQAVVSDGHCLKNVMQAFKGQLMKMGLFWVFSYKSVVTRAHHEERNVCRKSIGLDFRHHVCDLILPD